MPLRIIVADSETPDQKEDRRKSVGSASWETLAETVRSLAPGSSARQLCCVDGTFAAASELRGADAVLFAGSPIQMYSGEPETRSAADFMRAVFAAGLPSFGSCAGLQIAAVAAGGTCAPRSGGMESGFARGIFATAEGRNHPLLAGRPEVWDAPAMHSSVVDRLPEGAVLLARSKATPVEAAEIRSGTGVFWGVQYHPEVSVGEISATLRRQADELVEEGLAASEDALGLYADRLEALGRDPARRDIAWQVGLDEEVTDEVCRQREIANFLASLKR